MYNGVNKVQIKEEKRHWFADSTTKFTWHIYVSNDFKSLTGSLAATSASADLLASMTNLLTSPALATLFSNPLTTTARVS